MTAAGGEALSTHHDTLAKLFEQVVSCDPGSRQALLEGIVSAHPECAEELEKLLAYAEVHSSVFNDSEDPHKLLRMTQQLSMPTEIGDYLVDDVIGDGGMAVVYRGRQKQPERVVAIKMIKLGMDTHQVVARFELERQALATMTHAGIAHIYDAGVSDQGKPYFVMEYVDGRPVDQYCDEHALSIKQRLEVFASICDAVSHAHQKGIIHRDLKPGNILVSGDAHNPLPKVIDFGISRSVEADPRFRAERTQMGQIMGTPAYMSPEQSDPACEDIDTRTDVFSLGVILQELLIGKADNSGDPSFSHHDQLHRSLYSRPSSSLKKISPQALADLARARATSTNKLLATVKGDLDWILLKALSNDRTQRYQTVAELANDVRRFSRQEPVEAHPPSAHYQLKRLVGRNPLVSAVVVSALLALLASLGVLYVGISQAKTSAMIAQAAEQEAASQALRARHQSARASAVTGFLLDLFATTDPAKTQGSQVTVQALLERGADRASKNLDDTPDVQAALLDSIAQAYMNLGLYDRAEPLAQQALDVLSVLDARIPLAYAEALRTRAMVYFYKGDYVSAEDLHRQALVSSTESESQPSLVIAEHLHNIGNAVFEQGRHEDALALFLRALDQRRLLAQGDTSEVAESLNSVASAMRRSGDLAAAVNHYQQSLNMRYKLGQAQHPATAIALSNLGVTQFNLRDYAGAETNLRKALAVQKQVFSDEHPQTGIVLSNLGATLAGAGKLEQAEEILRQSVAWHRRLLGDSHPGTANALINLGSVLYRLQRYVESEAIFRECIAIFSIPESQRSPTLGIARINLANNLLKQNKGEEALTLATAGLRHLEGTLPESHPWIAVAKASLGAARMMTGEKESGMQLLRESLPVLTKTFGEDGARTAEARGYLESGMQF